MVRFETAPGEQMQADFTTIRRGRDPLMAFVATLGYSRATYVRFTQREDSATLLSCLREAFQYFGGVTAEVLFDNADHGRHRAGRLRRRASTAGTPALKALADEYGFRPRLCRPYRARTKGKVERFNGYLKGSFVVPLAATLKSAGLEARCDDGQRARRPLARRSGQRAHPRHDRRAARDRASHLERSALLPLPSCASGATPASALAFRNDAAMPVESLQHPLSSMSSCWRCAA